VLKVADGAGEQRLVEEMQLVQADLDEVE